MDYTVYCTLGAYHTTLGAYHTTLGAYHTTLGANHTTLGAYHTTLGANPPRYLRHALDRRLALEHHSDAYRFSTLLREWNGQYRVDFKTRRLVIAAGVRAAECWSIGSK
jgi:hypothetical protein